LLVDADSGEVLRVEPPIARAWACAMFGRVGVSCKLVAAGLTARRTKPYSEIQRLASDPDAKLYCLDAWCTGVLCKVLGAHETQERHKTYFGLGQRVESPPRCRGSLKRPR
jgi:hypothetical protein